MKTTTVTPLDLYRDLELAEGQAPAGGKGTLVKARADLLALLTYQDGVSLLDKLREKMPDGPVTAAAMLVRRGMSAPRAARLLGLELSEEVRTALMIAEDLRAADLELSLFSRALFDSASSGLAALKVHADNIETLTEDTGHRELTLKDLMIDAPELYRWVVQRYGEALGPLPDATA